VRPGGLLWPPTRAHRPRSILAEQLLRRLAELKHATRLGTRYRQLLAEPLDRPGSPIEHGRGAEPELRLIVLIREPVAGKAVAGKAVAARRAPGDPMRRVAVTMLARAAVYRARRPVR
jgi:hypothetical protein